MTETQTSKSAPARWNAPRVMIVLAFVCFVLAIFSVTPTWRQWQFELVAFGLWFLTLADLVGKWNSINFRWGVKFLALVCFLVTALGQVNLLEVGLALYAGAELVT